ncbi:CAAX amino protease [Longimycelium tulufanense]|uniref:CAAX amino protease n=1 Tax=Longimycelium tulufanense TaxID=907463 RepID=A0A8J3CEE0_9PSEU|nr:type II CAAX endopeptidase family protein [Longimycelium tulufanense]GGM62566.1 CAAX amino protease [Longimycelium tulufanense]
MAAETGTAEPRAWPAPAGARYDQLARVPAHRWWRPLLGTVVVALGWLLGMIVVLLAATVLAVSVGVPATPEGERWFADPLWEVATNLLSIAAVIPVVFLAARLVQRRRPGTVSSVVGHLRWRWLLRCLLVAIPMMVVSLVLLAVLATVLDGEAAPAEPTGGWVGWPRFGLSAAVLVVTVPLQAAAEEYLARGWFIQAFGAWFRTPWPGIVAGGLVFVVLHSISQVWGAADLMLYAVVLGWLTVRTGGLEAGIALHAVGNLMVFLITAAAGLLGIDGSAGDAPWYLFLANLVILPLYAWIIAGMHRRTRQERVVPARPAAA